jgi:hypothetical protein
VTFLGDPSEAPDTLSDVRLRDDVRAGIVGRGSLHPGAGHGSVPAHRLPPPTQPHSAFSGGGSGDVFLDLVEERAGELFLPALCSHCGARAVPLEDLAPFEQLASLLAFAGMCGRHWSNAAQEIAQSHGLTLLRAEEAHSSSD